jgi:hypothetical protein
MRRTGTESWRLSISKGDQSLHVALYLRDAYHISTPETDVPPALLGLVERVETRLDPSDVLELTTSWLWWWRRIVQFESRRGLGDRFGASDNENFVPAMGAAHQLVFDPVEAFVSLSERPLLQRAAVQTWRPANEWMKHHSRQGERRGSLVPKDVAEAVIAEHAVSPGRVRGAVIVLSVTGSWSRIVEPGVVLCSDEAYLDDSQFAVVLKNTFESGLNHPDAPD